MTMNSGRAYKELQASPEDAIAMSQGYRFTVRYGKQNHGYFATQSDAVKVANKRDAVVYCMQRADSASGASSRIILKEIKNLETVDTPAEIMAKRITEYIGASDGPISPLAKQRIVAILYSACPNKGLSEEVFMVLYPASSKEQFNRLWLNSASSTPREEVKDKPIAVKEVRTATKESVSAQTPAKIKTPVERFTEEFENEGLGELASRIVTGDTQSCVKLCMKLNIDSKKLDSVLESAFITGAVTREYGKLISTHLARSVAESRINGDILSLIRNSPSLIRMASNNDSYGIIEDLRSSGYGKRESEELAGEIISLNRVFSDMRKL